MITYDVIEIYNSNVVLSDATYEQCLDWIDTYGNILEYTIIEHNPTV
jgi:hypothetical protein